MELLPDACPSNDVDAPADHANLFDGIEKCDVLTRERAAKAFRESCERDNQFSDGELDEILYKLESSAKAVVATVVSALTTYQKGVRRSMARPRAPRARRTAAARRDDPGSEEPPGSDPTDAGSHHFEIAELHQALAREHAALASAPAVAALDEWMTARQAAAYAAVGYRTVLAAATNGELAAYSVDGRGKLTVLRADVDLWLRTRRYRPAPRTRAAANLRDDIDAEIESELKRGTLRTIRGGRNNGSKSHR